MTQEEFDRQYTSSMPLIEVVRWFEKFESRPCSCGEDGCEGWGMFLRDVPIRINLTTSQKNPNV